MSKNIFCLIKTCALIQKAPNTALNFLTFLLANLQISQHSMLVKHAFNEVRTSFWKIAVTVYLLVIILPRQVCSHSLMVRAIGGYAACIRKVLSFRTLERDYWGQNHEHVKEKDKEKNSYEHLIANDFIQTTRRDKYKILKQLCPTRRAHVAQSKVLWGPA